MNVGVADPALADLAWKLEAILKGYGGTHLLELSKGQLLTQQGAFLLVWVTGL